MDPFLVMYGSAASRAAERRRLDRELEHRRVIRERTAAADPGPRAGSADAARRGILPRLRFGLRA